MSVVDTNVLLQSTISSAPEHLRARAALHRLRAQGRVAVCRQILREYTAATTRPQLWSRPLSLQEATADTDAFLRRFAMLEDGETVWDELMRLTRVAAFGGKQVHDANIVAAMMAHGETRLLTFNAPDFSRFSSLIEIVVP